jgi:hypothetical protein
MLKNIMLFGAVLLFTIPNDVSALSTPPPSFNPPQPYYLVSGDSPAVGPRPATICSLSPICTRGDSHPSDAGYVSIAAELWEASGYARLEH